MRSPGLGFPSNRRDGARQLSIVVILSAASLCRIDHPIGQILFASLTLLSLYWWRIYRQLSQ